MIKDLLITKGWNNLNGLYIATINNQLVLNDMGIGMSLDAEDYDLTSKQDQDALVEYLEDCLN